LADGVRREWDANSEAETTENKDAGRDIPVHFEGIRP